MYEALHLVRHEIHRAPPLTFAFAVTFVPPLSVAPPFSLAFHLAEVPHRGVELPRGLSVACRRDSTATVESCVVWEIENGAMSHRFCGVYLGMHAICNGPHRR